MLPSTPSKYQIRSLRPSSRKREGVAVVEAAVSLPLLVLFVFAMVQFVNMVFIKQKITSACYIGMQQLVQVDAKEDVVIDTVTSLLLSRGITNADVEISPTGVLETAPRGTEFSLRVTAPLHGNLSGPRLVPISGNVEVQQWIFR